MLDMMGSLPQALDMMGSSLPQALHTIGNSLLHVLDMEGAYYHTLRYNVSSFSQAVDSMRAQYHRP